MNLMKGKKLFAASIENHELLTERCILLGMSVVLPLLLLLETKMHFQVLQYKNLRLIFAAAAFVLFCSSYKIHFVKNQLSKIVTACIYLLTSHVIFLNYINNFSFYYAALLIGTVTICSFYFNGWKDLLVYQLSMLLILLQASMLTVSTNVNIFMFLGFYIVMNCIVAIVQIQIFRTQHVLKNMAAELDKSTRQLKESNASLEQFAYVASHDLKEPLRTVNSYLGLLKKRYIAKLDADAGEFMDMCTSATKRMQELIDGLLKYSKTSADKMTNAEINLNEVLENVLDNLETTITENHAVIEVEKLPVLPGDKLQLSQLFQNLICNAIKYRSQYTPEIHIHYDGTQGSHALISVEDNGLGIPENKRDEVFKIFSRLHTNEAEGAGLGLAICKKIVNNHKGSIWIENSQGQGSKFCFTLQLN